MINLLDLLFTRFVSLFFFFALAVLGGGWNLFSNWIAPKIYIIIERERERGRKKRKKSSDDAVDVEAIAVAAAAVRRRELRLLEDADARTHGQAHLVESLLGQVGQFDHADLLLIEQRRVFL